jgi:phosphate starvation-inducible PhoH-like protein
MNKSRIDGIHSPTSGGVGEVVFELSEHTDTTVFYGVNNSNIQLLKTLHPNLRLMARGHLLKISGSEEEANRLIENLQKLERFCLDNNSLSEEEIVELVKGNVPNEIKFEHLIMHGVNGKSIMARTVNQQKLVKDFDTNDLLFAIGPAGSGKTYTAIALAVRSLKNREIKKIILSRPAVEAGEKLGFLPGDMKEKIDPYLQPLYDALQDMITPLKLKEYLENGTIQIAPLAFMRGRTLNEAVVILDEAQNTTTAQIKMFLTRMGISAKMIVTGDITQIDLPLSQKSGLIDALEVLKNIKGIARVDFDVKDIVRHKLVQRIVEAYEKRIPPNPKGEKVTDKQEILILKK